MHEGCAEIIIAVRRVVRMEMFVIIGVIVIVLTFARVILKMLMTARKKQGACDVYGQPESRDRDCLIEADRHRPDKTRYRLIADQKRDHDEHDGAGEAGQVAELASAEAKAIVVDVATREAISQRREQKGTGMRRHVQPVSDQRDRAEQKPADNLGNHHESAQCDYRPGAALVALVALAEKDVTMTIGVAVGHGSAPFAGRRGHSLEIGLNRLDQ